MPTETQQMFKHKAWRQKRSYFYTDKLGVGKQSTHSFPKTNFLFNRYDSFRSRKPLINSGTVGRELSGSTAQ